MFYFREKTGGLDLGVYTTFIIYCSYLLFLPTWLRVLLDFNKGGKTQIKIEATLLLLLSIPVWTIDRWLAPFFSRRVSSIRMGKKVNWKLISICLINGRWRMHSNLSAAPLFHLERRSGYYYLLSPGVNVFVAPPLPPTPAASFPGQRMWGQKKTKDNLQVGRAGWRRLSSMNLNDVGRTLDSETCHCRSVLFCPILVESGRLS